MNKKETAINDFLKFKNDTLLSRDKAIEIYNFFKLNPEIAEHQFAIGLETLNVKNEYFWHIINTGIIKKLYQTNKSSTVKNSSKDIDETFEANLTKLRKEALSYKQKLNFERNNFNKKLKEIISLEDLNKELINNIKKLSINTIPLEKNIYLKSDNEDFLVVQLSDLHIGEETNQPFEQGYNFDVASKRLKKFANYIKNEIITRGIKKVLIFGTGDLINSDSILSKQLNNATNKATAIIIATSLLRDFILDIYQVCPNINFGTVSGNEGRFHNQEDYYSDENIVNNSPDFVIFNMLNFIFENIKDISFLKGRGCDRIININGYNILFTHGIQLKGLYDKAIYQLIARYAYKNVKIRYVFTGHLHETYISNFFARSASLVGNNSYNEDMLNVSSRASQNISYISKNGEVNTLAVDLQDVKDIQGYQLPFNSENIQKGYIDVEINTI